MSENSAGMFESCPARIISLGESVHGSQSLHSLITQQARLLSSVSGQSNEVQSIGLEIPSSAGEALNLACSEGSPKDIDEALGLSYRIFRSPPFVGFFTWLQSENRRRREIGHSIIEIYGFDIRDVWIQRQRILDNAKLAAHISTNTRRYLQNLSKEEFYRLEWAALKGQLSTEENDMMASAAADIKKLADADPKESYETACRSVSEMLGCLSSANGNYFELNRLRDAAMARNVSQHAEKTDGRNLLIGHLTHLSELSLDQQIPEVSYRSPKGMGQILREKYGEDYACFGFTFRQGQYVRTTGEVVDVKASSKSIEGSVPQSSFEQGTFTISKENLPADKYFGHFEIVSGSDDDDSRDPLKGPLAQCLSGIVISQTSEAFRLP